VAWQRFDHLFNQRHKSLSPSGEVFWQRDRPMLFILSRRILSPIKALTDTAKKLGRGIFPKE
jgi:hypothetical protein